MSSSWHVVPSVSSSHLVTIYSRANIYWNNWICGKLCCFCVSCQFSCLRLSSFPSLMIGIVTDPCRMCEEQSWDAFHLFKDSTRKRVDNLDDSRAQWSVSSCSLSLSHLSTHILCVSLCSGRPRPRSRQSYCCCCCCCCRRLLLGDYHQLAERTTESESLSRWERNREADKESEHDDVQEWKRECATLSGRHFARHAAQLLVE